MKDRKIVTHFPSHTVGSMYEYAFFYSKINFFFLEFLSPDPGFIFFCIYYIMHAVIARCGVFHRNFFYTFFRFFCYHYIRWWCIKIWTTFPFCQCVHASHWILLLMLYFFSLSLVRYHSHRIPMCGFCTWRSTYNNIYEHFILPSYNIIKLNHRLSFGCKADTTSYDIQRTCTSRDDGDALVRVCLCECMY